MAMLCYVSMAMSVSMPISFAAMIMSTKERVRVEHDSVNHQDERVASKDKNKWQRESMTFTTMPQNGMLSW
jgi:hypothetical protein